VKRLLMSLLAAFSISCILIGVAPALDEQTVNTVPQGGISLLPPEPTQEAYWHPRFDSSLAETDIVEVENMPFQKALRTTSHKEPSLPWDIVIGINVPSSIEKGDACLLSFFVRGTSVPDRSNDAKTRALVEYTASPHDKLVVMPVTVEKEWRRIYVPFRPETAVAGNSVRVVFYLGFRPQSVEVGGVSLLNFGKNVTVAELPATQLTYKGREPDAAWRKQAAAEIEKNRKADISVQVVDSTGTPIEDAKVHIKMLRHAFGFGSAVVARALGVNTDDAQTIREYFREFGSVEDIRTYRKTVKSLFNKATLENDLKIVAWNEGKANRGWGYRKEWTNRAIDWLNEHDIKVRGHWLACGMLDDYPPEILRRQRSYVRAYLFASMRERIAAVGGRIKEWDAINHIAAIGENLQTFFGSPDIYVDIMKESRKLAPGASLWVNEGSILADGRCRDPYEKVIRYLISRDAAPDGIGFMGHFDRVSLTPPDELLEVFDRFAGIIPRLQVTELDVDVGDDVQLQADYLRDAMTVAFSHRACEGIVLWGFWEPGIYRPSAELYRRDWSLKPAGAMWQDLVFRQWWTDVQGATDHGGMWKQRGFVGNYEITAARNAGSVTVNATVPRQGTTVKITLP
jgi:endo-1,4-beta-xylanase